MRLAQFLDHAELVASPLLAAVADRTVVELTVGLSEVVSLIAGGRDLDNYLYPVAQRLGAARVAAIFGRKIHGLSRLAVGPARPRTDTAPPMFSTRMAGSYVRPAWKQTLRERLLQARIEPAAPGPVAMDITVVTGPGRNWASLWKPLLDSCGPILGEPANRPFQPFDDRIVDLGFHHDIDPGIGHDVVISAWWMLSGRLPDVRPVGRRIVPGSSPGRYHVSKQQLQVSFAHPNAIGTAEIDARVSRLGKPP